MFSVYAGLFLIMAAGVAARYLPGFPNPVEVRRIIGLIVLNFFLPALAFATLYRAHLDVSYAYVSVVAVGTCLLSLAVSVAFFGLVLRNKLSKPTIGALILASTFANATYLGLPIITSELGGEMAAVPLVFDMLGMTPILFTIGTVICVEYGSRGKKHNLTEGLLQVIKLPPFIAITVALLLNTLEVPIPEWFLDALGLASHAVVPLMVFSVGLALRFDSINVRTLVPIIPATVIKLAFAPIIGMLLTNWLIDDARISSATIMLSQMPTMILTMVFAERYGLDEETLAQTILVTTVLSVLMMVFVAR